jgi:hypothetical protein
MLDTQQKRLKNESSSVFVVFTENPYLMKKDSLDKEITIICASARKNIILNGT